jgi:hypothetical protein
MKVSDYLFNLINGVFEPLTNGTVWQSGTQLNTDAYSNEITLPFPFNINGTAYNSIRIYNNGFITLGKGLNNGTVMLANVKAPISNTVNAWANDYVISGFGVNLMASNVGTPQISFGQNLSNDFVVQYQDLSIVGFSQTRTNFQIVLKADGKTIQIIYGGNLVGQSGVVSPQVGLRGKAELINNIYTYNDWQNRKLITGDWNVIEAKSNYPNNSKGTMPSSTMAWKDTTVLPISGLTFQWKQ